MNKIEQLKKSIELRYKTFDELIDEQIGETGHIIGNAFFDEKQLDKLKEARPEREKLYSELEKGLEPELCFQILGKIYDGFLYLADDYDPIRKPIKLYAEAKDKLEKKVLKLNEELTKADTYFKNFPMQVGILPHHLDNPNPTEKHRPKENKNILIKELSDLLKAFLPKVADRSKVISRILKFFYTVPKTEATPENVRKHF